MFIKWGAPGDTGGGSGDTGTKSEKSEFVAKSVYDQTEAEKLAAFADRDRLREERRQLQTKLDDIEKASKEEKALKDGNIEALRASFTTTEANLKAEAAANKKLAEDAILRAEVTSVLSKIVTEDSFDMVEVYVSGDFEVVAGEDGKLKARPKNSTLTVEEYLKKKLESKPGVLRNERKAGNDTKKVDANGKVIEATEIPADIGSYDVAKLKEWMKANPKLAAQLATKAMGG